MPSNTSPLPKIFEDTATYAYVENSQQRKRDYDKVTARHRIKVVVYLAITFAALYGFQQVIWPHSTEPRTNFGWIWSWLGILWALSIIPAIGELIGLLAWRSPKALPRQVPNFVCWRVVSRGINREALRDTILACRREMQAMPLFPYVIEVITDHDSSGEGLPSEARDLYYIRVPKDYQTPNGTRNKARALNYALWNSPLADTSWIVHLDEESHPTSSSITGIAAAIAEEEASGRHRIGQGTITYERDWGKHPFFTLSDCIRTGSDFGKLYFSMLVGVPLFGLHGSFIVVRNSVEKSLGFDIGPVGSLTEDAWWGTIAMDRGYRCRWVEGHIAEQCTQRVNDFMKQRRRWFNGMARTSMRAPVKLRWRFLLGVSMLCWASAPFAWAYTIGHLIDGGYSSPVIRILADAGLGTYITTTLIGLGFNMEQHGLWQMKEKLRWTATWLVCLPFFSLMEAAAVTFAMVRPAKKFDVVNK